MRSLLAPSALGVAALLLASPAWAQKTSDGVVKISASADKPDGSGNQTVTITLDIDNPWHLYANPVDHDLLAPAQTTVKFPGKTEVVKITYPAGKVIKESATGDTYKVYEGKVTIKAQVKRARDETGPLEYSLTLQACDDKRCLARTTVKKSIP
jgi:uncharacterized protein